VGGLSAAVNVTVIRDSIWSKPLDSNSPTIVDRRRKEMEVLCVGEPVTSKWHKIEHRLFSFNRATGGGTRSPHYRTIVGIHRTRTTSRPG